MDGKPVSRRGVYYDLNISPYEYETPYGDIFKFSSAKKLEIYRRDVGKEKRRIEQMLSRHDLGDLIPDEIKTLLYRTMYTAFYKKIEG